MFQAPPPAQDPLVEALKVVVPVVSSMLALAGVLYQIRRSGPAPKRSSLRYDLENLKLAEDLHLDTQEMRKKLVGRLNRVEEVPLAPIGQTALSIAPEGLIAVVLAGGLFYLGILSWDPNWYWRLLTIVLVIIGIVFITVPIFAFADERKKAIARARRSAKEAAAAEQGAAKKSET